MCSLTYAEISFDRKSKTPRCVNIIFKISGNIFVLVIPWAYGKKINANALGARSKKPNEKRAALYLLTYKK